MYKSREEMLENAKPTRELIKRFMRVYKEKKPTTITTYKGALDRYCKYLEEHNIDKPEDEDLSEYFAYLRENNRAGATIQQSKVVLTRFYKWAEHLDLYPDITFGLKFEKGSEGFKRQALSAKDAKRLIELAEKRADKSIENFRDYVILKLILTTGLRTIEVSRADVCDLKIVNDIKYLMVQGKCRVEKDEKVKVPDSIYELILEYLEKRNNDAAPLFLNHGRNVKDLRIKPSTISVQMKHLLRAIGLDDKAYTAHSLRHTCATLALLNGAKFEEVQMVLRHKSITTTTIYAHNIKRDTNNVELLVEEVLKKDENK